MTDVQSINNQNLRKERTPDAVEEKCINDNNYVISRAQVFLQVTD